MSFIDNSLAIEMRGIVKEYPGVIALNSIDLIVKKGTIHGFLGPNGAGKSTTMNILAGLIPPTNGEVKILGEDGLQNPKLAKSKIGLLPEIPPLYENMTVQSYLYFVQELHSLNRKVEKKILEDVITRCGLKDVEKRLIGNLSKGYKQRVGIAGALVFGAEIIVLDEPTVGLDPNAIVEIRKLIKELKNSHTILLSTHQLSEAAKICDEITIINKGRIVQTGSLDDFQYGLKENSVIVAQMSTWSEEESRKLKEVISIERIQIDTKNKYYELTIFFNGDLIHKGEISCYLAKEGMLLDFRAKENELEDIFKEIVK